MRTKNLLPLRRVINDKRNNVEVRNINDVSNWKFCVVGQIWYIADMIPTQTVDMPAVHKRM